MNRATQELVNHGRGMSQTSPRPKISILISDFSQSSVGRWGGAVRTFILAEALETLGYDIELVGVNFGPEHPALDALRQRWNLKIIPGAHYPHFFQSTKQVLDALDGDIIYAHKLKPSISSARQFQNWRV